MAASPELRLEASKRLHAVADQLAGDDLLTVRDWQTLFANLFELAKMLWPIILPLLTDDKKTE